MQLIRQNNQLTLTDGTLSVSVDFNAPQYAYRRQQAQKELIAKAVGVKKNYLPTIVDATAGLGRDAFLLANYGCHVTLLERSPELVALLQDGLQRASQEESLREATQRMQLVETDSINYLEKLTEEHFPDVIYLDPMFPERKKSALVKKDMQLLQTLLKNQADDSVKLFNIALKRAKKRVVIKRPRIAPYLDHLKPAFQYQIRTCRFDIYPI